jgi:DNA-binding response OmpR family regulator
LISGVQRKVGILGLLEYTRSREGYHVLCAVSGEAALKAARNRPPNQTNN